MNASAFRASTPLLQADNLVMHFPGPSRGLLRGRQVVRAVDDISLKIDSGKTLGLVGESGCGKSTVSRVLMRLIDPTSGTILLNGQDITHMSQAKLRPLRASFQMIAQDPFSSLNPRMRIGRILSEPMEITGIGPDARQTRIAESLERVGLSKQHISRFPHEFSGGQRQRIAIARALVLQPRLVICDEPVSALDVSVQAQIINLLQDLQRDAGLTYLFISHDLGVVKHISTDVAVMYLGRIVETGPTRAVFGRARHPYTEALLSAIPRVSANGKPRIVLQGDLPSPAEPPSGCRFHTRCPYVQPICRQKDPVLNEADSGTSGHAVACHFPLA